MGRRSGCPVCKKVKWTSARTQRGLPAAAREDLLFAEVRFVHDKCAVAASEFRVAPRSMAFASAARKDARRAPCNFNMLFKRRLETLTFRNGISAEGKLTCSGLTPSLIRTAHLPRQIMAKPIAAAWLTAARFLASINEVRFIAIAEGVRGLCCCCACARVFSDVVEVVRKQ
jgi:hypothetical protein